MSNTWGALKFGEGDFGAQNAATVSTSGLPTLNLSQGTQSFIFKSGWGAGPNGWGANLWGDVANNNDQPVGQQLSSNIGSVLAEGVVAIGWGGDTWGENWWGDLSASVAPVSGLSLTSSTGQVTAEGIIARGWGRQEWGSLAWGIGGTVLVSGQEMSSALGTVIAEGLVEVGWGRGKWGNRAWGDTYSALLVGQQLTSSVNSISPIIDVNVDVTGQQLNFTNIGTFSVQVDANVSVIQAGENLLQLSQGSITLEQDTNEPVTGSQLSTNAGIVVAGTRIDVPAYGSSAETNSGQVSITGNANTGTLTGSQSSVSVGQVDQATKYDVLGVQAGTFVGTVSVTGTAKVIPTGQVLTGSVGTSKISAWNEIDPNVTNVWKEVDLAA